MRKMKRMTIGMLISLLIGMLISLLIGMPAHAADGYFWSDAKPLPSCSQNSREGGRGQMGIVIDGEKVELDLPACEEASKNHVFVTVDGKYLNTVAGIGAEPFIENGRTMLPLRVLADAFGFEVDWAQPEQKITLAKDGKETVLHIGKPEMLVDGNKIALTGAVPLIRSNVTFLPVRQLAEVLGIQVGWDEATRTAQFSNR
ncbi:copper amine oxidase N-terminal domain-containing protein [Xylanibacillus composti]|uniref:Copper amine oxidase-like N-terminal domain-containing protein n=1 Tax=Xylanibacillus composti TaxID=1572762 RepID=A0A8J4H7F0_9BACL|nr:copper amine oxidase N-terminal domain-containing protein [Xylanibacillus composti]GIQ71366.1 hypothetical protein XYCOK13_41900 [Xylanibacillus composti]